MSLSALMLNGSGQVLSGRVWVIDLLRIQHPPLSSGAEDEKADRAIFSLSTTQT